MIRTSSVAYVAAGAPENTNLDRTFFPFSVIWEKEFQHKEGWDRAGHGAIICGVGGWVGGTGTERGGLWGHSDHILPTLAHFLGKEFQHKEGWDPTGRRGGGVRGTGRREGVGECEKLP